MAPNCRSVTRDRPLSKVRVPSSPSPDTHLHGLVHREQGFILGFIFSSSFSLVKTRVCVKTQSSATGIVDLPGRTHASSYKELAKMEGPRPKNTGQPS